MKINTTMYVKRPMIKERLSERASEKLFRYECAEKTANPTIILAMTGREIAEKKFLIETGVCLKQYHNVGNIST